MSGRERRDVELVRAQRLENQREIPGTESLGRVKIV